MVEAISWRWPLFVTRAISCRETLLNVRSQWTRHCMAQVLSCVAGNIGAVAYSRTENDVGVFSEPVIINSVTYLSISGVCF
jgi:hypothetical protein